ncbi:MAG: pyruvate dehydrogenase (acetyl-transferring), homodimeric type [Bryobacterales bacterium]|nr:pyruvate dehydrogenase (acetyl-transferring), homodimeric type [Bryobacterales bacterium]
MLQSRTVADDLNPQETAEWIEALDQVIDQIGPDRARYLLSKLSDRAYLLGVSSPVKLTTPYVNTIPVEDEVPYPGNLELEEKLLKLVRWNAVAMVTRANKDESRANRDEGGPGGHLSTFASLAAISEVAFQHHFHGSYGDQPGDFVYYQGHASPGVYARAYLEGRLQDEHLKNFRYELRDHPGLSSYPHPWLMPDFWSFPTVSMGLGPINSIYQARFMRYLENRGLIPVTDRKIYAFVGDGESDEPETLGCISLASREKLDNLIWVVNCNLQRLDGPVRGNGNIIQELEGMFRGAGWNVIKVVWGSPWDDLFARDRAGLLMKRMNECVDGEYQKFKAKGGADVRQEFFGKYPELLELVAHLSDDELAALPRGGHDPVKVHNAFKRARETKGLPTVILAKTIKGYGLGEWQGRNATHNNKKLTEQGMLQMRDRFKLPLTDEQVTNIDFVRPTADSPEMQYLHERRQALGGYLPARVVKAPAVKTPPLSAFQDLLKGTGTKPAMTTHGFVAILRALLKDPEVAKLIVPIVPDESRTFGMESLFRQISIYAPTGQLYSPVDSEDFNYYKEARDGQYLQEGINEAGAMADFTAAGTAYANYGVPLIPFFIYYSMFGFQRIGDLIWAFADSRGKGFLVGGTAGRTTLNGEGLQHQDGHSPLVASTIPTCVVYDPAYAYELAIVIQDGIRRMYELGEDRFYYLTVYNEFYVQPAMPERPGIVEGVLQGIYKYQPAPAGAPVAAQLFGSGPILNEAVRAQQILGERYGVATDVWSVPSYQQVRREALETERWNRLHPAEPQRKPLINQLLDEEPGPIIASSDYMKLVPDQLAPWIGSRMETLGTDGFGRSENREVLRQFFEINAESIVCATLSRLARDGKFDVARAAQAFADLGVPTEGADPVRR